VCGGGWCVHALRAVYLFSFFFFLEDFFFNLQKKEREVEKSDIKKSIFSI
jgi:hypothetical protein